MARSRTRLTLFAGLWLCACPAMQAQTPSPHAFERRHSATAGSESRASEAFERARAAGPLALYAFLERMPKGADLHMHLSGAVYAETLLQDAAVDELCVDTARLALVRQSSEGASAAGKLQGCPQGSVPAASAFPNTSGAQALYDKLVDSFSMRGFVPTPGTTGHDQFFSTFGHFDGISKAHHGEWLDEIATRAAAQNEQYLEVMETPTSSAATRLGMEFGWPGASPSKMAASGSPVASTAVPVTTAATSVPDPTFAGTSPAELAALRDRLLAAGLRDEVAVDKAELAAALAARRSIEHCDTPAAAPGCAVEIRFLFQVLRAAPPQRVFAQTLLGFEVASASADVVGINFVQPEDAYLAMSEYHRQMLMLDYLHSVYPRVHISLHAGELAPGLVPPAGLRFHIREAVELGHAERIGHGVDAMYETDPEQLLAELARRHVMIEINLTSNDVILGVSSNHHSLPAYRAAHVPIALSTDDEGVSRIDLTHEYTRAATDFHLSYAELKQFARTSLEHSFLPGPGLWQQADDFAHMIADCAQDRPGASSPSAACAAFLHNSRRAAEQWELERRFSTFEQELGTAKLD